MTEMADFSLLMPRLIPQAIPAPHFVVLDALRQAAADFCTKAHVWQESLYETACKDDWEIPLLPRGYAIVRVLDLWLDGELQRPGAHYTVTPSAIVLRATACRDMEAVIRAAARPLRTEGRFPATLLETWSDVLCYGALARVKSMSGPRVEWTDPAGAQLNWELYERGVAQARIALAQGGDRRPARMQ